MIEIIDGRAIVGAPRAGSLYVDSKGQRYRITGVYRDSGMMRLYESVCEPDEHISRWWTLREYQCDRAKKILRKRG